MKKPTLIIGKKQIILAGMTLLLGAAVYANYAVSSSEGIKTTKVVDSKTINYGEAELVSSQNTGDDYFAQARIDKMKSRGEAVETLKAIMNGGDATEEEKSVASEQAANVTSLIETESKVEDLIKAQGFEDCVVYLDGASANIVVRSDGLDNNEAAQIKDILLSEVNVANENIRIVEQN